MPSRRLPSIRRRLIFLALACLVPAMLLVAGIVSYYYVRERDEITQNTLRTVRAMTLAIDQQFVAVETGLSVLATSRPLQRDDFAGFYQQAQEVLRSQPVTNLMLADRHRRQILNTIRPYGESLPEVGGRQFDTIMETRKPAIADLFKAQIDHKLMLAVGVPVMREGEVAYTLNAGISTERIQALLTSQRLPEGWIATVVDASGTIVARNQNAERFIGARATANLWARLQEVDEDTIESVSLTGVPVLTVFSRSPTSRWTVVIGIPLAILNAKIERQLWLLTGVTVLLLVFTLALSRHLSLIIIRSTSGLIAPAVALGSGAPVVIPKAEFREAAELGAALEEAAARLQQAREAQTASEAGLKKANDALVRSNIDLQQFAFVASHDLRTPLRSIHGYVQMLLKKHGAHLDEHARGLIQRTTNAVTQLDQLLQALLGYARMDSAGKPFTAVDCSEVLAATLDLLDAEILQTGARIDIAQLPIVWGDRTQLVQLFQNLLSNGLKYQPPGAIPRLTVAAEPGKRGEWVFWIKDNGIGIDARHHKTIFEVFKRLHAAQDYAGTGIGLALCERIVKRHGGRIWVDSAQGEGATFYFTLPRPGSETS